MTENTPNQPGLEDGDGLDGLEDLSGYSEADQYLATRFKQGGRDVYCIDLSVPQLVTTLPKPDPERPLDGNRKIDPRHAKGFATYVRKNQNWIISPLLLRAPEHTFTFEPRKNIGGTDWGVLTLPRLARHDLKIVDGQHRILGFHLAFDGLKEELDTSRGKLRTLERRGEMSEKRRQEKQVTRINEEHQRLAAERVAVQIVIVDAEDEYKQMFVDIANNAKGITKTVRARFDTRQIINRCLDSVMQHRLLKDRVDTERDRVLGENEHLMGVKHVADIVRTVAVGSGRITKKREAELERNQTKLIKDTKFFLDTLVEGFGDFQAVADNVLTAPELRSRSLLGSVVLQRMLAGVYHDLLVNPSTNTVMPPQDPAEPDRTRVPRQRSRAEVVHFFQSLAPHMSAPVTEDSIWVRHTEQFAPGTVAPGARAQELKALTATVRNWAITPPEWLRPSVREMAT